ncbi:MAG: ribbon-helix-helix protein, CopG family [Acidimicrobiales bacterium]
MHRTNIYLTLVEQAALDAKAAAEGSSRSEVLRALVDRELNLDDEVSEEVDRTLAEIAGELAERSRQLSAGDPDLSSSQ